MPKLELDYGSYVGVEELKTAMESASNTNALATTTYDATILSHVLAASRQVERDTLRRFYPVIAMNAYRWPPLFVAASWQVWTEDDLLSVSLLQVAAAGQNASPVTLTNYFLEPQQYGPPYNRIEVDLSSSDVFQSGPTPQRSVQITGQWGYTNATTSGGTLQAAITSTAQATISVGAAPSIQQGDVLLIDSEALYVDLSPNLQSGTAVVVRGVNGTTAATHLNSAAIKRYRAPETIRRLVRADAIATYQQDRASWSKSIGSGEAIQEYQGKQITKLRDQVVQRYARTRLAAV